MLLKEHLLISPCVNCYRDRFPKRDTQVKYDAESLLKLFEQWQQSLLEYRVREVLS